MMVAVEESEMMVAVEESGDERDEAEWWLIFSLLLIPHY